MNNALRKVIHACPFPVGTLVTWKKNVPASWRHIYAPGPMTIVRALWHSGIANDYAKLFSEEGMNITPGWILTTEFDTDAVTYYSDPPLRFFFNQADRIQHDVHEKWLKRVR